MSKSIVIDNFALIIGQKVLLQDTKLVIHPSNKYGLIGRNGSGKTTLLNHIVNTFSKTNDIFMVEQEFIAHDTVMNTILKANKKKNKLQTKINELEELLSLDNNYDNNELLNAYNKLYDKLNAMNVNADSAKIKKILVGLGFTSEDFDKQVSEYSGGWRGRVSLARALYMQPKVLILDEPTNHLDLDAVIWLTKYLSTCYQKTLIIVSHDKSFLNDVCNNIILIENKSLHYFKGNYDKYTILKKNFDLDNDKKRIAIDKKILSLKKKQVIGTALEERNKEIRKLEEEKLKHKSVSYVNIRFSFAKINGKNYDSILKLNDACFAFNNNKIILDQANLELYMGNKLVIVGRNGVGKSTLFKILLGMLHLNRGEYMVSGIRIGYFSQHSHEVLDGNLTPIEYLASQVSGEFVKTLNTDTINSKYNRGKDDPMEFLYRKCLGDIGLENSTHNQKINTLSGGQKSRVAFASLFVSMPHLILLDEPTNHLDMEAIDALIKCINEFNGTIVLITHNIELIEKTKSELYELKDGKLFKCDLDDYCDSVLERTEN